MRLLSAIRKKMRSYPFSRCRRASEHERGVIATETAFLIPVVLVGIMMFMELARIMLTVSIGSTAMDAAIQSLRRENQLTVETVKSIVAERMADERFSYGYLQPDDIEVTVEHFDSLEALGGNPPSAANEGAGQGQDQAEDAIRLSQSRPVWSITVDVRKPYITPLPTFLTLEAVFRYRFKQVLGHLEDPLQQERGS